MLGGMKSRTFVRIHSLDAGRPQPHGPIDVKVIVNERVMPQVGGRSQRMRSIQQRGAADRKYVFTHQKLGGEARILATAIANGDVNSIADEIGEPFGGRQPNVDIGMAAAKPEQPRNQPP